MQFIPHVIDGQEAESVSGAQFASVDPWLREPYAEVALGGPEPATPPGGTGSPARAAPHRELPCGAPPYWITGGCQKTIATWNASSAGLPPKASRPRSWIPAVLAVGPGTISTVAGSNGTY